MKILSIEETKKRVIDFLYARPEYIRQVNATEYQTRCPHCGDSQKVINTGHFYLHIDTDNTSVIPCYCFKCDHRGILRVEDLELMGCADEELLNGLRFLNKTGKYVKGMSLKEDRYMYFERTLPQELRYFNKLEYINKRLGIDFSEDDYVEMKVITSLYDFMMANGIKTSPFNKEHRMMLEKDYVGFLSSGNSHILFRDITDKNKYPWIKYPIEEDSMKNRVYYGLSSEVDVFSEDPLTINLSEGVFDALGIKHHFNQNQNALNFAVLGKNYRAIITHMIDLGLVGSNVTLSIYADNDMMYSNSTNKSSSIDSYRNMLKPFTPLFKDVNLFINLKGKDYGIPKEGIILDKKRI